MTLLKNFREINWFPYYKLRSLCQELFYVYVKNFQFFPGDSDSKKSTCNAEKPVSIPGSGRSPGEGNGNRLQYSCLENFLERSLASSSPWGSKESNMTERLTSSLFFPSKDDLFWMNPFRFYWWTSNIKLPLIFLILFPSSKPYLVLHACLLSRFSCVRLFATLDYSSSGSSVHRILQARMLEWVAMPSSRDLPDQGIKPTSFMSPALTGDFFTTTAA